MPIWKHVMYTSFLNCGGLSNFDFQINKRKNIAKILKGAQKHPKLLFYAIFALNCPIKIVQHCI